VDPAVTSRIPAALPDRAAVRDLAARTGLLPAVKRARALLSPAARRAQRDDANLFLLLAFLLAPDSACVDVGAHAGTVLAEMARLAPRGRHVAFEPLPHLAADLRRRFPGVLVVEAAASDGHGDVDFVHVLNRPDHSGLRERDYPGRVHTERIAVRRVPLDDALPPDLVPALIKIDVEGAELEVLRGARRTLREHGPVVVFEHGRGGSDRYGTAPEDVHALLVDELGMRLFDLDGRGPLTRDELRRAFDSNSHWNFVARP